jgi:hypothetical protein
MQGKAIPNANLINTSNVVTKIVGKFVDGSIKGANSNTPCGYKT